MLLHEFAISIFAILSDPNVLLLAIIGVAVGIILGALPGVSSTMALAILLPLSFSMEPASAILFLIAVFVSSVYGGSISAILINIPGTPGAIVTQLDGYPMTRSGRAGHALTYALIASTLGGLMGLLLLVLLAPLVASAAMSFRSPEFAMVAVFGLVLLAYASSGSTLRGILVGAIGLICGMVGFDKVTDAPRFVFETSFLQAGIDLVPLTVGLFGLAEVMRNLSQSSSGTMDPVPPVKSLFPPWRELCGQWKAMLRGSFIGTFVGAIPAAGSAIAVAIAYAQELRFARQPERFGKGAPEGIVAPEAANSSSIGGAMVPMMTLGIPGDAMTAVLMGSLLIHGLRPGPLLFTENPMFVSSVYAALFMGVILTLVIGLLMLKWIAVVMRVPQRILLAGIAVLCVIGAFAIRNNLSDVYVMLFFGAVGYLLYLLRLPAAPLAFGLILGPILEENLRRSLMLSRGSLSVFVERPIACSLLLLLIVAVLLPLMLPYLTRLWNKRRKAAQPPPVNLELP
jgi:putative tricarboxylic transport membrane protein